MTYIPRITDHIYTPSIQGSLFSGHGEGGLFVTGDIVGALSSGVTATALAANHLALAHFPNMAGLGAATNITGAISPFANISLGVFGLNAETKSLKSSIENADQEGINLAKIGLFKAGLRFLMGAVGAPRLLATAVAVSKVSSAFWIRLTSFAGILSGALSGLYMVGLSIGGFYQGYRAHQYEKKLQNTDLKGRVEVLLRATEEKDPAKLLNEKTLYYTQKGHTLEKAQTLAKRFFVKVAEKSYTEAIQKNLKSIGETTYVSKNVLKAAMLQNLSEVDQGNLENILFEAGLGMVASREKQNALKTLSRYTSSDSTKYFASMSPGIRSCLYEWIASDMEEIPLEGKEFEAYGNLQTTFSEILNKVCDDAVTGAGKTKKQQIILGIAGIFGVIVSISAIVLTAGLGPLIIGILGLLLNLLFLGIDGFFLKKSQEGEKPGKYDRLVNKASASLCLIAVLTTITAVATGALTFGVGPLIIMAATFLLWGGQCIYTKYGMDKAEKLYVSTHPELGHVHDLLQRKMISESEAQVYLLKFSESDAKFMEEAKKTLLQKYAMERENAPPPFFSTEKILETAVEMKQRLEKNRVDTEKEQMNKMLGPLLSFIKKQREANKQ